MELARNTGKVHAVHEEADSMVYQINYVGPFAY